MRALGAALVVTLGVASGPAIGAATGGATLDRGLAGPAGIPEAAFLAAPVEAPVAAQQPDTPPYDGRFTFLRLRFGESAGGLRRGRFGRGREPMWAHDMPRAERNFAQILAETTTLDPYMEGSRVLDLDDPELFKYPIAYIVEVGYWRPAEEEVQALREYLLKGGFLIVDDFRGGHLYNFLDQMRRVLPGAEVVEMDPGHRIFDTFFHIEDPASLAPPTYPEHVPHYLGIFEDNDRSKRLMAILNYNNDIAEYWEYSDYGYYPIDLANEAYKFGVNYVIYGMTY